MDFLQRWLLRVERLRAIEIVATAWQNIWISKQNAQDHVRKPAS